VIGPRALNRALLARQFLLERVDRPPLEVVEHLVGLQAQVPANPYVALWSRLADFEPDAVSDLFTQRKVVRIAVMRSTIHLVSAADCRYLRPLVQSVSDRGLQAAFGRYLAGLDLDEVAGLGRRLLETKPLTFAALGQALTEQWPDRNANALAQAVRARLPLVQVPPRGLWGRSGQVAHTTAESWLGAPLDAHPDPDQMLLRYFGAFGPASVMDAQTWCGLTRLGEVVDRLRPRLVTFRDETGRELFDLPDAPRPEPDVEAPVRMLPQFDNLLLSHADRTRVVPAGKQYGMFFESGFAYGPVLVDGLVRCAWRLEKSELTVTPLRALTKRETAAVADEATRLLAFLVPSPEQVRFATPE
jgi:hypothetical protein